MGLGADGEETGVEGREGGPHERHTPRRLRVLPPARERRDPARLPPTCPRATATATAAAALGKQFRREDAHQRRHCARGVAAQAPSARADAMARPWSLFRGAARRARAGGGEAGQASPGGMFLVSGARTRTRRAQPLPPLEPLVPLSLTPPMKAPTAWTCHYVPPLNTVTRRCDRCSRYAQRWCRRRTRGLPRRSRRPGAAGGGRGRTLPSMVLVEPLMRPSHSRRFADITTLEPLLESRASRSASGAYEACTTRGARGRRARGGEGEGESDGEVGGEGAAEAAAPSPSCGGGPARPAGHLLSSLLAWRVALPDARGGGAAAAGAAGAGESPLPSKALVSCGAAGPAGALRNSRALLRAGAPHVGSAGARAAPLRVAAGADARASADIFMQFEPLLLPGVCAHSAELAMESVFLAHSLPSAPQ